MYSVTSEVRTIGLHTILILLYTKNPMYCMSLDNAKTWIHAFAFSGLDYCNALFSGLPKKTTDRLQLVQKAAVSVD